jgi:hypothetical protein
MTSRLKELSGTVVFGMYFLAHPAASVNATAIPRGSILFDHDMCN